MVESSVVEINPLYGELVELYEEMPPQIQVAATYVLSNPKDVALMSMREQAQKAGVSHSTMVRLAHFIGLEGYEELRKLYIEALRHPTTGKRIQISSIQTGDDLKYSERISSSLDDFIREIELSIEKTNMQQISKASGLIESARTIFCLAEPQAKFFAKHFSYSFISKKVVGPQPLGDEINSDQLSSAVGKNDVILVFDILGSDRQSLKNVRRLSSHGVKIITITDNHNSAYSQISNAIIAVNNIGSSFSSIVKTYAIIEIMKNTTHRRFSDSIITVNSELGTYPEMVRSELINDPGERHVVL